MFRLKDGTAVVTEVRLDRLERVADAAREAYEQMSSYSRFPKERAARARLGAALDALDEDTR